MSESCRHPATQGRVGHCGSWCLECGTKVYEVHDKPCSQCAHFIDLGQIIGGLTRPPVCTRKLIAVSNNMHVTYKIGADFTAGGLCFLQGDERTNGLSGN